MEPSPKKILISDDLVSNDPFLHLHVHVHDLIYQHLKGRDVLKVFGVSPTWNEVAATSKQLMSQVRFRFFEISESVPSESDITSLLNSDRVYQNIVAMFRFSTDAARKVKLLHRFSSELVDLEVDCFKDKIVRSFPATMSFPKLKTLKVNNSPEINLKLLNATSGLKKLSINMKMGNDLVRCLKKQSHLKELELRGDRNDFFTLYSLQNAEFTLNSLTITNQEKKFERIARDNFKSSFSACNTASSIAINKCFHEDIDLVINQSPHLKSLKIQSIIGNSEFLTLKSNKSIIEFKFGMNLTPSPIPRAILRSLTKLDVLRLFDLTQDDFEWIVKNLNLKTIYFHRWTPQMGLTSIEEVNMCYERLKSEEIPINENIEIFKEEKI